MSALPRYATARSADRPTYGDAVAEIAELLGTPLLEWQRLVADVALEVALETGRLAYRQIVLTCPRQQGKSTLLLAVMVHRCLAFSGREQVMYAAQDLNASRKKWSDDFVAGLDHSTLKRLYRVRRSNGSEAVMFTSGARLAITASTMTSGHGSTLDLVVLDEAFAQTDDRAETSFRPPMLTRPEPQLWIVSTAGDDSSVYLREKVELGRRAVADEVTAGTCYFEWSADPDADPADESTWWGCMPALGQTITSDAVRADQFAMPPAAFARSCLNLWPTGREDPVIDPGAWAACEDVQSRATDPYTFAIDVTPNRTSAAIGLAARRGDGLVHLEVVDHRNGGTGWVVDRVAELVRRWSPVSVVLDPAGAAGSLIPALETAGVTITLLGAREHAQACGAFFDAVLDAKIRHIDQAALNSAVAGAKKRPLGDAWAWHRRQSTVDISPLVAVTLARHALETAVDDDTGPSVYETRGIIVLG